MYLADAANGAVSGTLITTAGAVVAAGIAAIAATFHRDHTPTPPATPPGGINLTQDYLDELIRRTEQAETNAEVTDRDNERLRRLLLVQHINPETGEKL